MDAEIQFVCLVIATCTFEMLSCHSSDMRLFICSNQVRLGLSWRPRRYPFAGKRVCLSASFLFSFPYSFCNHACASAASGHSATFGQEAQARGFSSAICCVRLVADFHVPSLFDHRHFPNAVLHGYTIVWGKDLEQGAFRVC